MKRLCLLAVILGAGAFAACTSTNTSTAEQGVTCFDTGHGTRCVSGRGLATQDVDGDGRIDAVVCEDGDGEVDGSTSSASGPSPEDDDASQSSDAANGGDNNDHDGDSDEDASGESMSGSGGNCGGNSGSDEDSDSVDNAHDCDCVDPDGPVTPPQPTDPNNPA